MGLVTTGVAGAGGLTYASKIEPSWLEVKRVTLTLPRLPAKFHGYKIVQISDLHIEWMGRERLLEIAAISNSETPDLVALTGDYVTRVFESSVEELPPGLSLLKARDGVVSVLGNHDYWGHLGPGLVRTTLRESGVMDLNNRVHILERDGARLSIAGLDSVRSGHNRLDRVLQTLPHEGGSVILVHEPDYADKVTRTGRFDLQLSGHSHGGQVVIPFVGPPRLPPMGRKYHTGFYQVGDMQLYTNRGLGLVGLPVRFCCRPELTVFTLQSPAVEASSPKASNTYS